MLSAAQKAQILERTGVAVPAQPPMDAGDATASHAQQRWAAQVNDLFATYVAERAARSLREAQATHMLDRLRSIEPR